MALAHGLGLGPRRKPFGGVGAHGLEHQQPGRLVRTRAAHQEALRDEPVEGVQVGTGDSLRCLHGGAAGEDREAREARPSSWTASARCAAIAAAMASVRAKATKKASPSV